MQDIQTALARWRAAERRAEAAAPGSAERAVAEHECDRARAAYEQLDERSRGRDKRDLTGQGDGRGIL
jgi:hypothetical protein